MNIFYWKQAMKEVVILWNCRFAGVRLCAAQRAERDCAVRQLCGWLQDRKLSVQQLCSLPALSPHHCFQWSACLPVTGAAQHSHRASSSRYAPSFSYLKGVVSSAHALSHMCSKFSAAFMLFSSTQKAVLLNFLLWFRVSNPHRCPGFANKIITLG